MDRCNFQTGKLNGQVHHTAVSGGHGVSEAEEGEQEYVCHWDGEDDML